MAWKITDDKPIWIQLEEQLTERIVSGCYQSGARLPSVRELAAEAGVNPNTMQRALAELESTGLLQTNRTVGRTVTEDMEKIGQKRMELAEQQICIFIDKMKLLGFSEADIRRITDERLAMWRKEE